MLEVICLSHVVTMFSISPVEGAVLIFLLAARSNIINLLNALAPHTYPTHVCCLLTEHLAFSSG